MHIYKIFTLFGVLIKWFYEMHGAPMKILSCDWKSVSYIIIIAIIIIISSSRSISIIAIIIIIITFIVIIIIITVYNNLNAHGTDILAHLLKQRQIMAV